MAPKPSSNAQILYDRAEKKGGSSTGWFSSFTSADSRKEEAGDLYNQAGNAFKLEKDHERAGDAFSKEAELREECKENNDAANAWWNAAKSFKQAGKPDLAVRALHETVRVLTKAGRFRQAADRMKDISSIHMDAGFLAPACEALEQAGEWYQQEDANAMANGCKKDAADLHAQLEEWARAVQLYEEVADHSLKSALTKYSVRGYWLMSGLCALANSDSIAANKKLQEHIQADPTFSSTREAKFLRALIESVENGDSQTFASACRDYDEITKLDKLKTSILLNVKKTIDEEPSLT